MEMVKEVVQGRLELQTSRADNKSKDSTTYLTDIANSCIALIKE
jgi:hypothetical protein